MKYNYNGVLTFRETAVVLFAQFSSRTLKVAFMSAQNETCAQKEERSWALSLPQAFKVQTGPPSPLHGVAGPQSLRRRESLESSGKYKLTIWSKLEPQHFSLPWIKHQTHMKAERHSGVKRWEACEKKSVAKYLHLQAPLLLPLGRAGPVYCWGSHLLYTWRELLGIAQTQPNRA